MSPVRKTRARSRSTARADRRAQGQALVEFALVVPVMLVLLLLAVDFGRLFFSYIAINNAAREATFYAATHAAEPSFDLTAFEASAIDSGGPGDERAGPGRCRRPDRRPADLLRPGQRDRARL